MTKGVSVNFKGILGDIFTNSDNCKGRLQKLQCSKMVISISQLVWISNDFLRKQAKLSKDYQKNLGTFWDILHRKGCKQQALNVNLQS